MAKYDYFTWGWHTGWSNDDVDVDIYDVNPFRYRSYIYDEEMSMCYLQSRYYITTFSRFLNSDLPEYAQLQKNDHAGLNLFAYCNNDPVNKVDYNGNKSIFRKKFTRKKYTYVFIYNGDNSFEQQAKNSYYYNYYSNRVIAKYVTNVNDFLKAWNNMNNVGDIYLYLHGTPGRLYFKDAYIDLSQLEQRLEKKQINGSVFLFSCKGGMGERTKSVAYKLSQKTYCSPVYASMVGVSYTFSAKGCYARIEKKYYFSREYYTYWMCFRAKYNSSKVYITNLWTKNLKWRFYV